ncbi:hypothetical protein [Tenacibaculum phage Larrie]|nr:hypothetical protein [Tenacibaculum phage Larrie]
MGLKKINLYPDAVEIAYDETSKVALINYRHECQTMIIDFERGLIPEEIEAIEDIKKMLSEYKCKEIVDGKKIKTTIEISKTSVYSLLAVLTEASRSRPEWFENIESHSKTVKKHYKQE